MLLVEGNALVFHCFPDGAFGGSFSRSEENSMALEDGDGLWFQLPLAALAVESATGHGNATQSRLNGGRTAFDRALNVLCLHRFEERLA